MIDFRIDTFIDLAASLSYTQTARNLNITQPAVTQHIQYLEELYKSKLFSYKNKSLSITKEGELLLSYANSMKYNSNDIRNRLVNKKENLQVKLGVTKTIGDYVISDFIIKAMSKDVIVDLYVNNTQALLNDLNNGKIDVAIIEGYFDKNMYDYKVLKSEELVGICSKNHMIANKEIEFNDIFSESLIEREDGSGTKEVLKNALLVKNYSLSCFSTRLIISNFNVIKDLVANNMGISFVYSPVANDCRLATFRIKGIRIEHDFTMVWLKYTNNFLVDVIDRELIKF